MDPLVMYSTNTWLAYRLAQKYYGGTHYVWCAPYFSGNSLPAADRSNPPSSTPSEIYDRFYQESGSGDEHNQWNIAMNKTGLRKGAEAKARAGVITEKQKLEILAAIDRAPPNYFKPLLYIIPYSSISTLVKEPEIEKRAGVLSEEYIIESLPRNAFDYIDYKPGTNF
jgi:hypothetical protein